LRRDLALEQFGVAAIRPQGVSLAATGIPARLESRRFLGEVELLELTVNGIEEPLLARVRAGGSAAPKSEVAIAIDPAEVLVFAASGA